jgi:hypothetical protein
MVIIFHHGKRPLFDYKRDSYPVNKESFNRAKTGIIKHKYLVEVTRV